MSRLHTDDECGNGRVLTTASYFISLIKVLAGKGLTIQYKDSYFIKLTSFSTSFRNRVFFLWYSSWSTSLVLAKDFW